MEQGEGPTGSQIIDIAQVQPDELRCSCQMDTKSCAGTAVQKVQKLRRLFEQEANLDHSLVTRFCEQLLFKTERSADVSLSPREWTQQKQVLLKYVQVSCGYINRQQVHPLAL